VPPPLRPEICPLTVADRPLPDQTPETEPLPLTRPENPSDDIWPPEMATVALVLSVQVVPTEALLHIPSKPPPPPPPPPPPRSRRDERSLCDERSLRDGSRSRLCEVERELPPSSPPPEIDLSCFPTLPPIALCDSAGLACKQNIAAAATAVPRIKLAIGNRPCIDIPPTRP
jgi:hypothetical protein